MALMGVEMTTVFISILIFYQAATTTYAQDGFISLDCGSPPGTNYTEDGINYISDDSFIEAGVSVDLSGFKGNTKRIYNTRRSFHTNNFNCYTVRLQNGKNNKYLIRAKFQYGDPNGQIPQFDLYFGANYWSSASFSKPFAAVAPELIHVSTSDFIHVCLLNTGRGYPFITTLELRPLDITMYQYPSRTLASPTLAVARRVNFGTTLELRYNDDKYDRIWNAYPGNSNFRAVQASDALVLKPLSEEKVPLKVMKTALTPVNSTNDIFYSWSANDYYEYIFYIYIAEVEMLEGNQKREFDISVNNNWIKTVSPSTTTTTITSDPISGSSSYELKLSKTKNSTLPPILNALEVYEVRQLPQNQTDDQDVAAIWSTKSSYGLKNLNWQGDPCIPEAWVGLNCSYHALGATKIISLNLSSRGLSGDITIALANLTMIESLDLSYNNLTGNVPEFLARLENLRTLNLMGNNFRRPLPAELVEKLKKGSLQLSIEEFKGAGDATSCLNGSCSKKKHKISRLVPILAPIIGCILIFPIIIFIVKRLRKKAFFRRDEEFLPRKEKFRFSELVTITNKFRDEIGSGGFGKVYLGSLNDKQVAVKMVLDQGDHKKFQAEVKLLMKIHHINITSLYGYCNDKNHKGFVYEFMAKGNLEEQLFGKTRDVLSWERRIQIGCDVAEGLAYLHHCCKPPIVHRDIKPSNILLSRDFQAKLADFGLSRAFPTEGDSLVKTENVGGTLGYLDPKCFSTKTLTQKSDVYSFGVVLLVLITSRQAIISDINIIDWVKSQDGEKNVQNIIDPRLDGHFNMGAAYKVVKIAIECVSLEPSKRPTMNNVARDLQQCM